ncbi:MAG: hypothetical protein DSZ03_05135 [Sulfurimonas sp.]|nr:MAG: hypothetical protein DSZ03_05135 [Sulfurimonas sp.]
MKKTIIIAEDNELNITILDGILHETYDLIIARSAEEVYQILKTETADLFLLDIVMSKISGIDLCKSLRQDERYVNTPIVFMTAVQDEKIYDSAFKVGASAFIAKPFKSSDLKNTLSQLLSQ